MERFERKHPLSVSLRLPCKECNFDKLRCKIAPISFALYRQHCKTSLLWSSISFFLIIHLHTGEKPITKSNKWRTTPRAVNKFMTNAGKRGKYVRYSNRHHLHGKLPLLINFHLTFALLFNLHANARAELIAPLLLGRSIRVI